MSMTSKDHYNDDHPVQLMILHEGIGNLGGDPGKHKHQLESKEHLHLGTVRSFKRREAFTKSKQDAKKHDRGIK
jgi:hypothetical protein